MADKRVSVVRKGSWRGLVPFTVFLFVFGVFCLVWATLRWENVPYAVGGLINLAAGCYFARDIRRRRRAERETGNATPGATADGGRDTGL